MAQLWCDGFDHYGSGVDGRANMLNGPWAELTATSVTPTAPAFGARTGTHALNVQASGSGTRLARRVLPAAKSELIVALGLYLPVLPSNNDTHVRPIQFCDGSNNALFTLSVSTTGALVLRSGDAGSAVVSTSGPVIQAGTWHHIECKLTINASTGTFELRVDEVAVITATGLNTGSTNIEQLRFANAAAGAANAPDMYIDDLIVRDTASGNNDNFAGDLRIATLFPNADTDEDGWTPFPRQKIGTGILDTTADDNSAVSAATSTQLDLGSGDYTLEAFVRFKTLPTGSNKAVIASRWQETSNQRSYQLYKGGPSLGGGNLVFRISTNGQAGTVSEIISWPWEPEVGHWYHVAVVRASGETMLFIDGEQQGLPATDGNTYFASSAAFSISGEMSSSTAVVADTGFLGFYDEFRLTKAVARYLIDFTPTAVAFPRDVGGDPDFANVVLLAGFDSSVADESSFARTLTARNSAARLAPNDGTFTYQTINEAAPIDDNFVEASLEHATGTFTLADIPSNSEEVVVGTETYIFKTVLADPFDVLIGASAEESLDNLTAAINGDAGEGTTYGTGTTANADATAEDLPGDQILVTAITAGTAGNSIATTTDAADGSWSDTTLLGGVDIPDPSEFTFQRPPPDTTIIKTVTIVNRSYKSDSGAAKLTVSFIGPNGAADDGTEHTLTVNPTYREDIFFEDPDTSAAITPSTMIGARVRLDRTE